MWYVIASEVKQSHSMQIKVRDGFACLRPQDRQVVPSRMLSGSGLLARTAKKSCSKKQRLDLQYYKMFVGTALVGPSGQAPMIAWSERHRATKLCILV